MQFDLVLAEVRWAPHTSCAITWETSEVVWVSCIHGVLSREYTGELVKMLRTFGVTGIKAQPDDAPRLPYFRDCGKFIGLSLSDWR